MRNFTKTFMTLFDSANASFTLKVECQPARSVFNQSTQQYEPNYQVYITKNATALLNPNIYLVFSYKSDDAKPLYTSYPQLYMIRKCFKQMLDYTENGFFKDNDGTLMIRPEASEPIVIPNIGKANNWISLKLAKFESGENGVVSVIPGVTIQLSTTPNNYVSTLSVEEFQTVYSIIMDLNFPTLQAMNSFAFLDCQIPAPMNNNYNQQPYMNQAPAQSWGGPSTNPYGGGNSGYAPQQQTPRYNNNGYRSNNNNYRSNAPQQQTPPPYNPAPMQQEKVNQPLPERNAAPKMTLQGVAETPISEISYDDTDAIDGIFGN